MNLFKHQQEYVDNGPDKGYLVWGTGTGKTITSLHWAADRSNGTTLIVVPKALVTNWYRNSETVHHGQFLIVTKEQFKTPVMQMKLKSLPIDSVIIDEAHYFTGTKSQLFKTMYAFLKEKNIKYFLGLTATPYLSTPWNIYALGCLIDKKDYSWSWIHFKKNYFIDVKLQPKNPYSRIISKVKSGIETEIADKVREIASVVSMAECTDVPESLFTQEFFQLTGEQIKAIKNLNEPVSIVYWTKSHQIMGGGIKGGEFEKTQTFSSDKFDRLIELVRSTNKPIVVCRYNHEIKRIQDELTKLGITNSIITGAVNNKQEILDQANKDTQHVLVVNAACSEGWNAQGFDTMIFYSMDFSLKNYIQMQGRIQRIDGLQKCNYISLIVSNSVDEDVYTNVVVKKQDFQIQIYDGKI